MVSGSLPSRAMGLCDPDAAGLHSGDVDEPAREGDDAAR